MKLNIAHRASEIEFSHFDLYRTKSSGGFEINYIELSAFFTSRGYYLFRTQTNRHILIRIIDNIVKEIVKKDLKDELINFLLENEPKYIHEFFLKNISKALNDDFLETLPAKQVEFKRDKKSVMQVYYANCIVKITKDSITTHPYTELNGYIWESQILQRNFILNSTVDKQFDFIRFIVNISNEDEARINSIGSALGFLLHNYKSDYECPAIVLNDEVISDNPEGGTGKGLLIKAIKNFRNTVTLEGKTFDFNKNFVYQRINSDTQILAFEDVVKNFDFERLFSVITEGIAIEKKGIGEMYIPFDEAPKIIITTNYAIKGRGNSFERRRFELEISQYYNKVRTPYKEFGRMMYKDWDEKDWNKFDNYMMLCCQYYLNNGLVEQTLINLPEKRLMAETCSEFLDFMEDYKLETGNHIKRGDFFEMFRKENPTLKYGAKSFYNWIKAYSDFHNYNITITKSNGIWNVNF